MLMSWKRCALEFGVASRQAPMMGPSSELLELLDAMSKAATESRAMQPADLACAGAHGSAHLGHGGQEGTRILSNSATRRRDRRKTNAAEVPIIPGEVTLHFHFFFGSKSAQWFSEDT